MYLSCLKCGSSEIHEKPVIYPEQDLEGQDAIIQQVVFLCKCGWGWNCVGSISQENLNKKNNE